MKICFARLRSGDNYVTPLDHIMDSFYALMLRYVMKHTEHEYYHYNFGFNQKPVRNIEAIKNADIIVIPSEAEFTYHIPGAIHTLDLKRSNSQLEQIKPYINGKRVIILRSDRRDDIELYQTKVFPGLDIDYRVIDEIDFGNVHGMKYHFIKNIQTLYENTEKTYDFAYWGSDKRKTIDGKSSGDVRHTILKQIHKNENIKSYFIGRFYGFERNQKWGKMKNIIPTLKASKCTLCFNWMNPEATTSRYIEAIACDMIPLVWQNYDTNNIFVSSEWQRVNSYEDFVDKVSYISYSDNFNQRLLEAKTKFLSVVKTPDEYYDIFENLMERNIAND